jgi:hypothetical protein
MNKTSIKRQIDTNLKEQKCFYKNCNEDDVLFVLKKCSRCLLAAYCTPKCQKEDWINHKLICKKS